MEVLSNSCNTYSKWQLFKHLFKMATLQNGNSSNRPLGLLGLLRYLRLKSVDYYEMHSEDYYETFPLRLLVTLLFNR